MRYTTDDLLLPVPFGITDQARRQLLTVFPLPEGSPFPADAFLQGILASSQTTGLLTLDTTQGSLSLVSEF